MSLLFLQALFSQEVQGDSIHRYREDQFYLGISFVTLLNDEKDFNQNGLSGDFQIGFIRDMPLVANGRISFGLGIGYEQQQFNSNLLRLTDTNSDSYYVFQTSNEVDQKMKYHFKSLAIPLTFRWRTSSPTNYKFWRFYSGVKLRWTFSSEATKNRQEINIKNDIHPWTTEGFISFGYNTWNIYLGYEFSSIFNQRVRQSDADIPLDIRALKFGLIFYVL
ncbi:PorT family protein [Flavobacteriaceae bacterium]|nr:PorT family protein [Flavobacteriaceae bacterium]